MRRILWSCFVIASLFHVSFLLAAAPTAGDKVHLRWAGQDVAAEVISVDPRSGWIKVKFQQNGIVLTPTLKPDKVFADRKALDEKVNDEEEQLLELLRSNSDGKNISDDEQHAWHAPGRGGQKQGPLLVTARVKACRAGSQWVILEERQGDKSKDHLIKIEQVSNDDRKYLFGLLRQKRR